ncbi:MAG: nucleotidyltransferase domain-containing protein [Bacteroidales bacterium]
MAKTIAQGFNEFLTRLTPSASETEAAKSHRASIKSCLESNWGLTSFFRTGSFGNGTNIKGYSDVDYFAVIPTDRLKTNSNTSLTEIRNTLNTRFPNTGVRVDTPSIVLPFGTDGKETTEVVPADYVRQVNGNNVYDIPNYSSGWMKSSPTTHNDYVREIDNNLSKKVKPLIRYIKAWKFFKSVPLTSFYLELRVTKYAEGETYISYSTDIYRFLKFLVENELPAIQDPKGISGLIQPCKTDLQKQDALSKLNSAFTRACKALEAEQNNKIEDAFYWWNLMYDGTFPAY